MVGKLVAGGGSFEGHSCDSPVQVRIDGMGLPIIDDGVTVYERKDGPTSITRRAEVHFPITDGNTVWLDEIDAFRENGRMEQATIDMEAIDIDGNQTGNWERLLHGYVGAVGARGAANTGRLTIFGPFKLLSSIPAGVSWNERHVRPEDVMEWIVETFNEGQDIFDDVVLDLDEFPDRPIAVGYDDDGEDFLASIPNFTENRDTLADVVKTLIEKVNLHIWFEPKENGDLALRAGHQIDTAVDQFDLTEDGDVPVISNDALYEMRPFNGIKLRGQQNKRVDLTSDLTIRIPFTKGSYPEATATYGPLVERAGGEIIQNANSRANGERGLRREARSELKSQLDEISGGTMDTALAPFVHPYDTVIAKPACASVIDADVPALTYEVERAAHTVAPTPPDSGPNIPSTELAVSMHIDPSKIDVESTIKTTQPSREGKNKPPDTSPNDSLDWDFFTP